MNSTYKNAQVVGWDLNKTQPDPYVLPFPLPAVLLDTNTAPAQNRPKPRI